MCFHPRGEGGSLHDVTSCLAICSHVPSRGVSNPGPMFLLGGLCPGGLCPGGVSVHRVSVQWGYVHGGLCRRGMETLSPLPNQKSGRYASYYLLQMISNCDTNFKEFFSWNFRHNNNRLILPSAALIIFNLLKLKHVWNRSSVQIIAWQSRIYYSRKLFNSHGNLSTV